MAGWLEAPRARKTVLPVDIMVSSLSLRGWFSSKWVEVGVGEGRTGLHANEAVPGIVGARVAESRDDTSGDDGDVCVCHGDV